MQSLIERFPFHRVSLLLQLLKYLLSNLMRRLFSIVLFSMFHVSVGESELPQYVTTSYW